MSSKQSGTSGVIGRVLDTFRPSQQPTFECVYCGLSYDSDRLNCPACGGPVDEQ
jgi:hypothetical protein